MKRKRENVDKYILYATELWETARKDGKDD